MIRMPNYMETLDFLFYFFSFQWTAIIVDEMNVIFECKNQENAHILCKINKVAIHSE